MLKDALLAAALAIRRTRAATVVDPGLPHQLSAMAWSADERERQVLAATDGGATWIKCQTLFLREGRSETFVKNAIRIGSAK